MWAMPFGLGQALICEHIQQEGVQLVVDRGRKARVVLEVARQERDLVKGLAFFDRGCGEAPARVVARDLTCASNWILHRARTARDCRT